MKVPRFRRSRFPRDMLHRLDVLGRFEFDPQRSGIGDSSMIWRDCQAPFLDDLTNDRDRFLADLRALVAGDITGFIAYGASQLVTNLIGYEYRTDDALALLDGAIAFKRARGLPRSRYNDYEWRRWMETGGQAPV
jgi:hypothetical protein